MARKALLGLLLTVAAAPSVEAQRWAEKMFETTKHDFGTIARNAKEEYRFELSNLYIEDVHIADVRSSCGCTIPRIEKPLLHTYEKSAIVAQINTRAFLGKRGATLTVTIDKPYRAQVQLQVSCYIRSDVVLDPSSAILGAVEQGKPAEKKLTINYAGRSDWTITDVWSQNPHLSGTVNETSRGGGRVSYELTVKLDDEATVGYLRDHLVLATNDRISKQVLVPVEASVKGGITVSPNSLFMGVLQPGQKVTKQLVVRGECPFRIVSINCDGGQFEPEASSQTESKPVHLIPITFVAGQEIGQVRGRISIKTDLDDSSPQLSAFAVVSP